MESILLKAELAKTSQLMRQSKDIALNTKECMHVGGHRKQTEMDSFVSWLKPNMTLKIYKLEKSTAYLKYSSTIALI